MQILTHSSGTVSFQVQCDVEMRNTEPVPGQCWPSINPTLAQRVENSRSIVPDRPIT